MVQWEDSPGEIEVLNDEPLAVFTPFVDIEAGEQTVVYSASGYDFYDTVLLVKQGTQPWGRLRPSIGGSAYQLAYGNGRWAISTLTPSGESEWDSFPPRSAFSSSGMNLWTSADGFKWEKVASFERFFGNLEALPQGFTIAGPRGQFLLWSLPPGEGGEAASFTFREEAPDYPIEVSGAPPEIKLLNPTRLNLLTVRKAEEGDPDALTKVGISLVEGRDQYYADPLAPIYLFNAAREQGSSQATWELGKLYRSQGEANKIEFGRQLQVRSAEAGWWEGLIFMLSARLSGLESGIEPSIQEALTWGDAIIELHDSAVASIRNGIQRNINLAQLNRLIQYHRNRDAALEGDQASIEAVTRAIREEMEYLASVAGADLFERSQNVDPESGMERLLAFAN
jgi:hypothetical protein